MNYVLLHGPLNDHSQRARDHDTAGRAWVVALTPVYHRANFLLIDYDVSLSAVLICGIESKMRILRTGIPFAEDTLNSVLV